MNCQKFHDLLVLYKELSEFEEKYGKGKTIGDWIAYIEERENQEIQKIQERAESLSLRFAKKLDCIRVKNRG
ncbi:hypothetical protein [Borrelia persica]|uniref:hypothetical protein n=1 Tax=Borrelia persica TaxID=44448 RepID=UPI0004676CF4|nr:hypothetical protein [Borrelia persica]